MDFDDCIKILEPHSSSYIRDGKSFLEIKLITPLCLSGPKSSKFVGDKSIPFENMEMPIPFCRTDSQFFFDRVRGYKIAMRLLGDPDYRLADWTRFPMLSLTSLDPPPVTKIGDCLPADSILFS